MVPLDNYIPYGDSILPVSYNFLQKMEGALPNSFYESSVILIPQISKTISRKEKRILQVGNLINIDINILKIRASRIQKYIKSVLSQTQERFIAEM